MFYPSRMPFKCKFQLFLEVPAISGPRSYAWNMPGSSDPETEAILYGVTPRDATDKLDSDQIKKLQEQLDHFLETQDFHRKLTLEELGRTLETLEQRYDPGGDAEFSRLQEDTQKLVEAALKQSRAGVDRIKANARRHRQAAAEDDELKQKNS